MNALESTAPIKRHHQTIPETQQWLCLFARTRRARRWEDGRAGGFFSYCAMRCSTACRVLWSSCSLDSYAIRIQINNRANANVLLYIFVYTHNNDDDMIINCVRVGSCGIHGKSDAEGALKPAPAYYRFLSVVDVFFASRFVCSAFTSLLNKT